MTSLSRNLAFSGSFKNFSASSLFLNAMNTEPLKQSTKCKIGNSERNELLLQCTTELNCVSSFSNLEDRTILGILAESDLNNLCPVSGTDVFVNAVESRIGVEALLLMREYKYTVRNLVVD